MTYSTYSTILFLRDRVQLPSCDVLPADRLVVFGGGPDGEPRMMTDGNHDRGTCGRKVWTEGRSWLEGAGLTDLPADRPRN